MLKTRLVATILFSVALIGLALWSRLAGDNESTTNLVSVSNGENAYNEIPYDEFFLNNISTASTTPLTQTDLISRQLFSNYVEMASQGQTSSADLEDLATRYADGILHQGALTLKLATLGQITTVADTEENLQTYGRNITTIRDKYQEMAKQKYISSGVRGDTSSPQFKKFMSEIGDLYTSSSRELIALKVPFSLAINHLAIINIYLENAAAMNTVADVDTDPINIYSAINNQTQNTQKEAELFLNIQRVMMANGIILE